MFRIHLQLIDFHYFAVRLYLDEFVFPHLDLVSNHLPDFLFCAVIFITLWQLNVSFQSLTMTSISLVLLFFLACFPISNIVFHLNTISLQNVSDVREVVVISLFWNKSQYSWIFKLFPKRTDVWSNEVPCISMEWH